ncbi:MAG: DNA-formamidopyrimidine glycosylase family protein [Kineosporiaceae bacterium]
MPEGDVVWRTARRLHQALAGAEITGWDMRWPSLASTDLRGDVVTEVASRGKHLLLRTRGGWTLHSHLRMEGSWRLRRTGAGPVRERDVRAVVASRTWTAVGVRLGMLDLVPTDREGTLVGHLGPDVLGPGWDPDAVRERIAADPRTIGETLLDQRVLAGVGTFYLCEACFLLGLTPWTPAATVDAGRVVSLVHRLLTTNRERAVQVTTGSSRPGENAFVHARSGLPCRRCSSTIRVAALGEAPQQRVAFWCPTCQKGPTPTDHGLPMRPLGSAPRRSAGGPRYRSRT